MIRHLTQMNNFNMGLKVTLLREGLKTLGTTKRLFLGVDPDVVSQMKGSAKFFLTIWTNLVIVVIWRIVLVVLISLVNTTIICQIGASCYFPITSRIKYILPWRIVLVLLISLVSFINFFILPLVLVKSYGYGLVMVNSEISEFFFLCEAV